jgi:hypothetical protein
MTNPNPFSNANNPSIQQQRAARHFPEDVDATLPDDWEEQYKQLPLEKILKYLPPLKTDITIKNTSGKTIAYIWVNGGTVTSTAVGKECSVTIKEDDGPKEVHVHEPEEHEIKSISLYEFTKKDHEVLSEIVHDTLSDKLGEDGITFDSFSFSIEVDYTEGGLEE